MPAMALVAVGAVVAAGCGGTLEGKYRRGQLTTTSTSGPRAPATNGTTPAPTPTPTVPTSGNAAHQAGLGEPEAPRPGGSIEGSAVPRAIAPPLGGRHR
jgi:hypothetical protein